MKRISKEAELSIKALGAAMFMATVCLYMIIGFIIALVSEEHFYYHISFALLIQGMIASMLASATWILCFGSGKTLRFFARFFLSIVSLVVIFVIFALIPVINSTEWYILWLISGLISALAFGTAIAVLSEKHLKRAGVRSTLLWELK